MDLHNHSYRKEEFVKVTISKTLPSFAIANVYRFFYDIFNTSLLNNIGFTV